MRKVNQMLLVDVDEGICTSTVSRKFVSRIEAPFTQ